MKVEAETGIMEALAKKCLVPSKARRSKEGLSPRTPGESMALLDFKFLVFETVREEIVTVLSHQVSGNLLCSHRKLT